MKKSSKIRKRPTRGTLPDVVLNSQIIKEELPLPFVFYPNCGGVYIGFGESDFGPPVLCECAKGAIENYLRLREKIDLGNYTDRSVTAPLSSHDFPQRLADVSLSRGNPLKWLKFVPKVCHRCNLATPSVRWSGDGAKFEQYYGWYVYQTINRLGVMSAPNCIYLNDVCPPEIMDQIDEFNKIRKMAQLEREHEPYRKLEKLSGQLYRKLGNHFENITREEFGFRKVGEGWISESLLYKIISRQYPGQDIIRHHRPEWLDGLELDIFIPDIRLAFEYQGQQHFHPIKAWGGKKALVALQERDARKRQICIKCNVKLIEIDYTEPLTDEYVEKKIAHSLN
ncbi:MAG: hypothetical protein HOE30_21555 [Deltaproteobacteria bacterium]|nr:hypothetical protein [Deltaproteobacteria bacterium]MBT4091079.1 hypothetical protein [Deltaproteobacteria bacterium]MBT4264111.1 hypothetical protein [Deltaproteobacteria bacterium]MBT6499606.1 hypothetical protein [Deltaproteobacteria bacterium]MBT7154530.1 hypothetical protein [Deltaproteobacteria bacterium]